MQEQQPKAVVAAATSRGRELLAASAADTDSPLLADVLKLSVGDNGMLHAERSVYSGKVLSDAEVDLRRDAVRQRALAGVQSRRAERGRDGRNQRPSPRR